MKKYLTLVFEDDLSLAVMERLLVPFKSVVEVHSKIPCQGFGKIKKNIGKYNGAAKYSPFFVLTDLDRHECSPKLIREWLPKGLESNLLFRVAEREVESWLLADRTGFADYLGVSAQNLPMAPDNELDAKQALFNVVKKSRKNDLKKAILPSPNARIGPAYNLYLSQFVRDLWNPNEGQQHSPSLNRAMERLKKFVTI